MTRPMTCRAGAGEAGLRFLPGTRYRLDPRIELAFRKRRVYVRLARGAPGHWPAALAGLRGCAWSRGDDAFVIRRSAIDWDRLSRLVERLTAEARTAEGVATPAGAHAGEGLPAWLGGLLRGLAGVLGSWRSRLLAIGRRR